MGSHADAETPGPSSQGRAPNVKADAGGSGAARTADGKSDLNFSIMTILKSDAPVHDAGRTKMDELSDIGIWYGVGNCCHNPGHCAEGVQGHGVHTLMKGLATRLPKLAAQVEAPMLILMIGDCWPVRNWPLMMKKLEAQLKEVNFCWLGYFTNEKPNRNLKPEHLEARGDKGPLFNGNAKDPRVFPAYGCQMLLFRTSWIPEMCTKMSESTYPHGFDRWIFSPNFCTASELTFPNWSLAGQQQLQHSDSWGEHNPMVGEVDPPVNDFPIELRNMDQYDCTRKARVQIRNKHKKADYRTRKKGQTFGPRADLAKWNTSIPSSWFIPQQEAAAPSFSAGGAQASVVDISSGEEAFDTADEWSEDELVARFYHDIAAGNFGPVSGLRVLRDTGNPQDELSE